MGKLLLETRQRHGESSRESTVGGVPGGEHLELREAGRHGREGMEGVWRLALPWEEREWMAWRAGNVVGSERDQLDITDTWFKHGVSPVPHTRQRQTTDSETGTHRGCWKDRNTERGTFQAGWVQG